MIAGDKGLAGSYNANVLNLAWEHMQKRPVHYVITIGQMARCLFESKKQSVDLEFTHAVTNPTMHDARGVMRDILDLYDKNLMDEVIVAFTKMQSTVVQTPQLIRLLPIMEQDIEVENAPSYGGQLEYDPSPKEVLDVLVPQYLVGSHLFHAHPLVGKRTRRAYARDVQRQQKRGKDARHAQSRIQPFPPERHHDRTFGSGVREGLPRRDNAAN